MTEYGERYEGNGDGYAEYGGGGDSPPAKTSGFDDFGYSRSQVEFESLVLSISCDLILFPVFFVLIPLDLEEKC